MKRDRTVAFPSGSPLRIVLGYTLFGALWILLSDKLMTQLVPTGLLGAVSIAKGWIFIAFTALLLHFLIGRHTKIMAKLTADAQEKEALFRSLFEQAAVGVAQIDSTTGRFVRVNRRYCEIVGYSREELESLDFQTITHPDDLAADLENMRRMVAGEILEFSVEKRYFRKNGELVWVNLTVSPLWAPHERPAWHIAMAEDITKRKRAEGELHEALEKLRTILQSAPLAIISADRAGVVTSWNTGAERIFGWSDLEAMGRICPTVPPEGLDDYHATIGRCLQGEIITGMVGYRQKKDMTIINASLSTAPLLNSAGEAVGATIIIEDITERKNTENNLQRNSHLFQLFIEHSPASVAMFDRDMKYIMASRRFLLDYGLGEQNLIGRSHYDVFPEIPEEWREIHRRCLAGAVERSEEDLFPRLDGTSDWVRWEIRPWYEAPGKIGGVILFSEVITARKLAELELKKHREQLEVLVAEKTQDLQRTQLALQFMLEDLNEANEKLREVDRLKSMFIASMSHELRTPLNSVIGFSSIMLNEWIGPLNDEQKKSLTSILRSGKHLLSLINDVIDVSKTEAGMLDVSSEEFELGGLLAELEQTFAMEAEERGLSLTVPQLHLDMRTDRRRLLQCLLNLVSNAIKFTEQGEITLIVRKNEERGEVTIAVTDTGIGIEAEDQGRLFQAFNRIHSPISSRVPGTGLGLYLTKKIIVEILHGSIRVASEPGKGSTFSITFPGRLEREQKEQQIPVTTEVKS